MRSRSIISLALFTSFALLACGGSKKPPAEPESSMADGCLKIFQRQRECTDVFIPALVGWRVELDVPGGVAATDASEGRESLVAKAKAEWAASNSDAQLTELCTRVIGSIPPEQLDGMMALGDRCMATATCEEFTTCLEPMQRKRLEEQKAAESAPAE